MVDEDTFLVAALAASSANEINRTLDRRDPNYAKFAAQLNHRDILQGRRSGAGGMTRAEAFNQNAFSQPYQQPQPPPQYNYNPHNIPPIATNHDFETERLIDSNVNSLTLQPTQARLIPMPTGTPQQNTQQPFINNQVVTDFQIPNFGGTTAILQQDHNQHSSDMSSVVILQSVEKLLNDVTELLLKQEKKINRLERKINEIHKHLNINPKEKNDSI